MKVYKRLKQPTLPWKPAPHKAVHVTAVQQLEKGECTPDLQQELFAWLIYDVSCVYDQSYHETSRDTDFAEGKRFVGNTLIKMLKLDPGKVRSKENG